jgi:hypothetical protein
MSQLGHSRHFDGLPMTSDLRPETDIVTARLQVSNVPNPDSCTASLKMKEAAN